MVSLDPSTCLNLTLVLQIIEMASPDITLYTGGTPNGHKVSVLLEELGLEYKTRGIDLGANEQKEE